MPLWMNKVGEDVAAKTSKSTDLSRGVGFFLLMNSTSIYKRKIVFILLSKRT